MSTELEALPGVLATRRSPLHDQLVRQGAQFGVSGEWAYPLWFDRGTVGSSSLRQARRLAHADEHRLARSTVGVFDVSLLGHLLLVGPSSMAVLNRLSTSNLDVPVGRVVYTQWCNDDGLIQADVIIARTRADRFMVVVGDTVQTRCRDMLEAEAATRDDVHVVDMTSGYAVITIAGPRAELVMGRLTGEPVGVETFAPMRVRDMFLRGRPATVMTVSYTGERSFEVHVPTEYAASLYRDIGAAAAAERGGPCGIDAMYSLGTENGSLDYDYDLDDTVTPLEAGLGHLIAWDKPEGFRGEPALVRQRLAGLLHTRILGVHGPSELGDEPSNRLLRGDIVFRNDVPVGRVLSATFGFTMRAPIAMVKVHHVEGVTELWVEDGEWQVEHCGIRMSVKPFSERTTAAARAAAWPR